MAASLPRRPLNLRRWTIAFHSFRAGSEVIKSNSGAGAESGTASQYAVMPFRPMANCTRLRGLLLFI